VEERDRILEKDERDRVMEPSDDFEAHRLLDAGRVAKTEEEDAEEADFEAHRLLDTSDPKRVM
jgi:hypothetical protein